jgi:hypothetical protein
MVLRGAVPGDEAGGGAPASGGMTFTLGRYRFRRDGLDLDRWHRWLCTDEVRGIYGFTPFGAYVRLALWYRRFPRSHRAGCDGSHHRGEVCPGH